MAWIVKLVGIGAEGEEHSTDIMRIARPDDLADLAAAPGIRGIPVQPAHGRRDG